MQMPSAHPPQQSCYYIGCQPIVDNGDTVSYNSTMFTFHINYYAKCSPLTAKATIYCWRDNDDSDDASLLDHHDQKQAGEVQSFGKKTQKKKKQYAKGKRSPHRSLRAAKTIR